jgi:hypothetical protein
MARAAIFEKIKQRLAQLSDKQDRNVRFSNIGNTAVLFQLDKELLPLKTKTLHF